MTLYNDLYNLERDLEKLSKYNVSTTEIRANAKGVFESYKSNPILQSAINKEQTIESKFDELFLPRKKIRLIPEKKLDSEYLKQAQEINELISADYLTTRRLGIIVRPIVVFLTMWFSMGNTMGDGVFTYENWSKGQAKYIDDKIKEYIY